MCFKQNEPREEPGCVAEKLGGWQVEGAEGGLGAGPVSRMNPADVRASRLHWGSCSCVPAARQSAFASRALYNHGCIVHSVSHAHPQMYTQYYSLRTQRKLNSTPLNPRREAPRWTRRGLEVSGNQPQDTTNHILQFHGFSLFLHILYKHCQHFFFFFTRKEVHDCGKKNKNLKKSEKYCLHRSKNGNVGDGSLWQRLQ